MSHKISSCGFLAFECFHAENRIQNGVGRSNVFLFLKIIVMCLSCRQDIFCWNSLSFFVLQHQSWRYSFTWVKISIIDCLNWKQVRIRDTISGYFIICYRVIYIMDKIYTKNSPLRWWKKLLLLLLLLLLCVCVFVFFFFFHSPH